jgi:isopentenyl diphosphate isomerase/L-lactate dehydrogenase-like FMN-dependent dehydrogenase
VSRRERPPITGVAAAERTARQRLPKTLFERVRAGAGQDVTNRENVSAFREVTFQPRVATPTAARDLTVSVLGSELRLPVLLAPTGGIRMVHPDGELGAARAAGSAGTACAVSMFSGHGLEEIAAVATGPLYQQIYMTFGRSHVESTIGRALEAGYHALVLTVDVPVLPHRPDPRPLRADLHNAVKYGPELVTRPGWLYRFMRDGMPFDATNAIKSDESAQSATMTVSWQDMSWIRAMWPRAIVVKGILRSEDAVRAVEAGADAIVVSNHGGKGLDGAPATIRVLPRIVKAVGGSVEILLDGGVRTGADVVRAIALGAGAVLIGRPYIWGLAAGGERGVHEILDLFAFEIDRVLGLLGCSAVTELDETFVEIRGGV